MKKLIFIISLAFIVSNIYPEGHSIFIGGESLFGYRNITLNINNVDTNIKENDFIVAPGILLFGRIATKTPDIFIFIKTKILFPQIVTREISIELLPLDLPIISGFDTASIFEFDMGISKQFFPDGKHHLIIDLGTAINVFLFQLNGVKESTWNLLGVILDIAYQYDFTKHLRLEFGLNPAVLFGTGNREFVKTEENSPRITQSSVSVNVSPYLVFGYVF